MLKTLEVYKELKDLRAYYVNRLHPHLPADIKHSVGVLLLNQLFTEVEFLAEISCLRDKEKKTAAAEEFLAHWESLIDKFEFLVERKAISYDQGAVAIEKIIRIEKMVGGLRKSFRKELPESPIHGVTSEQSAD